MLNFYGEKARNGSLTNFGQKREFWIVIHYFFHHESHTKMAEICNDRVCVVSSRSDRTQKKHDISATKLK